MKTILSAFLVLVTCGHAATVFAFTKNTDGTTDFPTVATANSSLFGLNGSGGLVMVSNATFAAASHTHTFASLTSKPTTLAGYGITDAPTGSGTSTGTNTGDQTTVTGNAGTVTTLGNLTGDVTSINRDTAIAPGVIVNADINASAGIVLSKTNISLTTTGSSGAATLNTTSGVLNIPQYSGGGPMDFDALTAATEADIDADDLFAVSHDGTEKGITLDNLIDLLEAQVWTFSEMNITTAKVGTMVFEGATADASETTIAVTDPTADRTVTLRDATGTVILSGDTFNGDVTATLDTDGGTALTIEDSVTVTGWAMGASTATTPSADDSDTSLATTAFVQGELPGTQTSTHASPATGSQSPTWTGAMHTVWHGATSTVNLPAASGYTGRGLLVYNTGAFTITIEPNGSEIIVRDGTAQTGGANFTLASGAGNFVALISDGVRWITLGYKGTLTAGS